MEMNLLADLAERAKQQKLDKELDAIKSDIKFLMEMRGNMNFIEVTAHYGNGTSSKISINPYYIVTIEDRQINDTEYLHYILLRDGTNYRVEESREEILKMINRNTHSVIG